jgi:hypothetical protein
MFLTCALDTASCSLSTQSLGMGACTHPSGPSSPSTLGRCQNTMVPFEPSPPRSTNTRRSWSISLPVLDSGVEPARRIAHAASSQALDRAGPRPRAVGPATQRGTSTAASWKDIRLFTLLDSLLPTYCLASVARKEATSTQLCNTSRHVGTRSGAGPAATPPAAPRTYTMATQAMMTQTNCMRHRASQQRAQGGGGMRKQYPPAALSAVHVHVILRSVVQ